YHGIDLVVVAQRVDQFLQLIVADSERPVRRETLRVRDRHIGKSLPDHGHTMPADLLDGRWLEDASRRGVESLGIVERSLLGEEDILRQELALEPFQIVAQCGFTISEFPM